MWELLLVLTESSLARPRLLAHCRCWDISADAAPWGAYVTGPCPPGVPGQPHSPGLLQAGHRRAPVDWLPGLQALPFGAVGPSGQQLHQEALMRDTGGAASPPGRPCHRASWTRCPTCAAIPAWGGPCGCQGHSFPGGRIQLLRAWQGGSVSLSI